MKRIFSVLTLALCLSCAREPAEERTRGKSEITVSASVEGLSRSLSPVEDAAVRNLNVYAYRDGVLAGSAYGTGGEISLSLAQGYTYRFYVLANVGRLQAPSEETALSGWRVALPPAASFAAGGLPMACRHGTAFHAARPSATLSLSLERLVGKVCLTLDKKLSRTDFTVSGVQILQAATDVTPFSPLSSAQSVCEGDAASSLDVDALNRGEEVCFYVPENSGGLLLPGNLDQWKKVPSQIGGKAALCSYMQVWGSWSTPGASADVTYRMYLGKDNCSDFSVDGNTESLLTLSLTDEGVFAASWKVEMRNLQDGRRLRFPAPTLSLAQGGGSAELSLIAEPPGLDFQLYADAGLLSDAQMSYSLDALHLHLHTAYIGTQEKTARLYLRSWDGLLTDTLTVTVPYVAGEYTDFSYTMPRYITQWGSFRFPHASVSAPVRFAVASRNEQIYPGAARWTAYDNAAGLRFEYDGNTTVWVQASNFPSVDGVTSTLSLGCGSLSRTLSLFPGTAPRYGFAEPLSLSECGNLNVDAQGWYDREVDLHLLDSEGEVLDFSLFATPDAVLRLRGITPDDPSRYQALYESYSSAMWGEFSVPGYAGYSMVYLEDDLETLLAENSLARFRLWGLKAEGDEPASLSFAIVNDGLRRYYEEPVPLEVLPAFPAQRFLGEYENRQIAPGAMRSDALALGFTDGGHPAPSARDVTWTLSDAVFSPQDKPSAAMMAASSRRCSNVSFDGSRLHFSYDRIAAQPLCAGAYGLTGEAVNPHTGRRVQGWYTFDVVLYMTVGACVTNLSETVLGYAAVPFCEYASRYDADLWNDALPPIPVSAILEDGSRAWGEVRIPERPSDYPFSLSLNGAYDLAYGSFSYNCYYLAHYTNWRSLGDLFFCVDGRETTALELTRTGYAATSAYNTLEYTSGTIGYYRLRRQRDIANLPDGGTYGLSNYMVEAAFGSFIDL